ncbi:hypothetical protein KM043_003038 [Ampulex compressa]|nr:hypothetical protein KM043_003038 [Ampulex compressa]
MESDGALRDGRASLPNLPTKPTDERSNLKDEEERGRRLVGADSRETKRWKCAGKEVYELEVDGARSREKKNWVKDREIVEKRREEGARFEEAQNGLNGSEEARAPADWGYIEARARESREAKRTFHVREAEKVLARKFVEERSGTCDDGLAVKISFIGSLTAGNYWPGFPSDGDTANGDFILPISVDFVEAGPRWPPSEREKFDRAGGKLRAMRPD